MSSAVLDSSAVLAVLLKETGAEAVMSVMTDACMSTVNYAEVIAKLSERGVPAMDARSAVEMLDIEMVDFDKAQAVISGELRETTRSLGLSLGDRACLALAQQRRAKAVTTDTAWRQVASIDVTLIR